MKAVGRFPAEITIMNLPADLKTLVSNFTTLQTEPTSLVLTKTDQLEACSVTLRTMVQPNNTQVSESPISETITGFEGSATISVAKETPLLVERAFNTTYIPGVTVNDPGLHRISDKSGLTVGACNELPFRTVVIRPYGCGDSVLTDPEEWLIFPWAFFKADANPSFGIGTQFSYNIMFTAFPNPVTGKDRVLRGNTALLPVLEYPTP
jgi:hypothetical protein